MSATLVERRGIAGHNPRSWTVPQKITALNVGVRVKRWGKSPPGEAVRLPAKVNPVGSKAVGRRTLLASDLTQVRYGRPVAA